MESTSNSLTLVFTTDTGNYGLNTVGSSDPRCEADGCGAAATDDPGFYVSRAQLTQQRLPIISFLAVAA